MDRTGAGKFPALNAFNKENLPRIILVAVTAATITVTGVIFRQSIIRIIPLYVSLIVGILQSRASRYALLIGGINSILYALVYVYLGLYASAGYALLFSFPLQIVSFVAWSKRKYQGSTRFRELSNKARIAVFFGFAVSFAVLQIILEAAGSNHRILDNLSSLSGVLVSVLTIFAFVEYTWIMLPAGILSIALNIATVKTEPGQVTYVVFSVFSMICVTAQFFRVRRLYAEQRREEKKEPYGTKGETVI